MIASVRQNLSANDIKNFDCENETKMNNPKELMKIFGKNFNRNPIN